MLDHNSDPRLATAEFFGGPYDGLVLSVKDLWRFCSFMELNRGENGRHFAIMPPLHDWNRVLRGKLPKCGPFDSTYWYELICPKGALVFVVLTAEEVSAAINGW